MSSLRSVIITLPKGIQKSTVAGTNQSVNSANNRANFTASILSNKSPTKMEDKNVESMQLELPTDTQNELIKTNVWMRGKKRRLDHLTWEEKLQRKKLKNRVAAQTSRDRKKAKLDELEDTVNTLMEKNEFLTQECAMLRAQNETLIAESKLWRKKREENSVDERYWWSNTTGIVPDADNKCHDSTEDTDALPPLDELFGDIQSDDYLERLEELAESLLREVTAEVEANVEGSSKQIAVKEDTTEESNDTKRMVGKTSKNVETSSTCGSVNTYKSYPISTTELPGVIQHQQQSIPTSKLPGLIPKGSFKREIEVKQEPIVNDMDTVYGTYDEATNCITIIYPGDDDNVRIEECVQEITSEESGNLMSNNSYKDHLSPAYTLADSMSPSSNHSDDSDIATASSYKVETCLSDCGYESHDSPISDRLQSTTTTTHLTDLWHESFSELFPSLA
ncbi:hypothetical protein PV325_004846 [Microctonus aethiopoides]|nr:hypothetical protein PV325_004846 [Microctonus aethiopoides]